jgi:hypothetical protein
MRQELIDIKYLVEQETGLPVDQQVLMYAGQVVGDRMTPESVGLHDGATIFLVSALRAG